MSKQIEKLKKQLTEISEVVNAFQSEAVQVKIIEKLLDVIIESDKAETESAEISGKKNHKRNDHEMEAVFVHGRKKPGATKVLNQLLSTDFFYTPRSIHPSLIIAKTISTQNLKPLSCPVYF